MRRKKIKAEEFSGNSTGVLSTGAKVIRWTISIILIVYSLLTVFVIGVTFLV